MILNNNIEEMSGWPFAQATIEEYAMGD